MSDETYKETTRRIAPLADQFIHDHQLDHPLHDSMSCLTHLGYYIIKSKAPRNLSGFYMNKDNIPFIFVNTSHSLGRQNFSMWHEVYHHISGHENGISEFGTQLLQEREAEIFAGCVLMPESEIEKWKDEDFSSEITIAKMSSQYQISFTATLVRVMQTGHIDYNNYKTLKAFADVDNADDLIELYKSECLDEKVLLPTENTKISVNILEILRKNHDNGNTSSEKTNEIIDKIGALAYE